MRNYPPILRAAPVVSLYYGARAIQLVNGPLGVQREDVEQTGDDLAAAAQALPGTRSERDAVLERFDPILVDILSGLRETYRRHGEECTSHCAVSVRRALAFALERVAPIAEVLASKDPRAKMRDDGKGPTVGSRVHYAFRGLRHSGIVGKMLQADILLTEGLIELANGPVHRQREEMTALQLDLMIRRLEIVLLSLAAAYERSHG